MKINLRNVTQEDFDYSWECLEACKQDHAKKFGFNYPYFSPGGGYGEQWWQLDSALALCGYKWEDRKFAETALLNFIESQKEDGRICLWGEDILPPHREGNHHSKQNEGVSSLPKIFDVAYHILKGSTDNELKKATYTMLKKYNDWWFLNRQDKETGLITAVFEETFIPYLEYAGEYAAVDTNTEVYVGCHYLELLANELGYEQDAQLMRERKNQLKESINTYLWWEEKSAYYPYNVKKQEFVDLLMASTFCPFRLQIASKEQQKKLIELLKNHEHFNYDTIPLTSVSKLDKQFITTKGPYQGNKSWSGNVWTLINEVVVRGLLDCGENELAADLALKTVYAFNHNCTEFVNPFDGSGHGVIKYAWSASQYIELIIEVIFGVSYDAAEKTVTISPKLADELKDTKLSLENLKITQDTSIDIFIDNGEISYSLSNDKLNVAVYQ